MSGGKIVIAGAKGIFTSEDAVNWQQIKRPEKVISDIPDFELPDSYASIATDGGRYVVIPEGGSYLAVFEEGSDEIKPVFFDNSQKRFPGALFYNVEWNGTEFLAWGVNVGSGVTETGKLYPINRYYLAESADGYDWTVNEVNQGRALSMGNQVNTNIRPDLFWIDQKENEISNYSSAAWNGKRFVALFDCFGSGPDKNGSYIISSLSPARLFVAGEELHPDVKPVIDQSEILVPMGAVFEKLGYKIKWSAQERSVTATKGSSRVFVTIGYGTPSVNGKYVQSAVAPVISGGRVMIPVGLISEGLGCKVEWNEEEYAVKISEDKG